MDELEDILIEIEKLFTKKSYHLAMDRLQDDVLDRFHCAKLYTWRARCHNGLRQLEPALIYVNKAISIDKLYHTAYKVRGNTWLLKNDYDQAISDYTTCINLKKDDADAYYNRAITWYKKGDNTRAIEDYETVIQLQPDRIDVHNNKGLAWLEKGDYDNALADFETAIKLTPDKPESYYNKAIALQKKSQYEAAIDAYSKSIERKKNFADAYTNRGGVYIDTGQYDLAIKDYKKATKINPLDANAYFNLGVAYEQKKNKKRAFDLYEHVLKLDTKHTSARYRRDIILAKSGKSIDLQGDKADEAFYKIISIVKTLENDERQELVGFYKREIDTVLSEIRDYSHMTDEKLANQKIKQVAHYSNLKVADLLILNNDTRLRYSNAVFMNDPDFYDNDKLF